jgi:uncharacterized protein YndB with AHSA1/START domain
MTHPFEIELETTLPASPEQVWAAIATGPGIDSWFMGRNKVEPREGGIAAMDTGSHREEAVITAYEPGKRIATRTATAGDGRFAAFSDLIEGRDGRQHRAPRRPQRPARRRLAGRVRRPAPRLALPPPHAPRVPDALPGTHRGPVFAVAQSGGRPAQGRAALTRGLSLPTPVTVGARAHAEPADLPPLDGEVVWSDDERIEVRTADGIYTFHGFSGVVLMFHHLFGPDTDGAEGAWQRWLTGLLG